MATGAVTVVVLGIATSRSHAQQAANGRAAADVRIDAAPAPAPIPASWRDRTVSARFNRTPLADVIRSLSRQSGRTLTTDWNALDAAGITQATPITIAIDEAPAAVALRLILDRIQGDGDLRLGIAPDGEAVTISTERANRTRPTVATYDARDLIVALAKQAPDTPRDAIVLAIQNDIQSRVAPDTWRSRGGLSGSVNELNGTLIISHTLPVHEEIAELLERWRANAADGHPLDRIPIVSGTMTVTYALDELVNGAPPAIIDPDAHVVTRDTLTLQLADLIRDTIAPDTWREHGGDMGSITVDGARLVIDTHLSTHRDIVALIDSMRSSAGL